MCYLCRHATLVAKCTLVKVTYQMKPETVQVTKSSLWWSSRNVGVMDKWGWLSHYWAGVSATSDALFLDSASTGGDFPGKSVLMVVAGSLRPITTSVSSSSVVLPESSTIVSAGCDQIWSRWLQIILPSWVCTFERQHTRCFGKFRLVSTFHLWHKKHFLLWCDF